jgi:hypothetical protein
MQLKYSLNHRDHKGQRENAEFILLIQLTKSDPINPVFFVLKIQFTRTTR